MLMDLGQVKHFNAICSTTKKVVQKVYCAATSQNTADFLENVISGFPLSGKIDILRVPQNPNYTQAYKEAAPFVQPVSKKVL